MVTQTTLGKQLKAFVRFGAVGFITAAIYALLLILLVEGAGQSPAVGVSIAYVLAVVFNYCGHHIWTYRSDQPHHSTGPRYLIVLAIVFCSNVIATAWLPQLLGISYATVQMLFVVIAAAGTFTAQSTWVFSRRDDAV